MRADVERRQRQADDMLKTQQSEADRLAREREQELEDRHRAEIDALEAEIESMRASALADMERMTGVQTELEEEIEALETEVARLKVIEKLAAARAEEIERLNETLVEKDNEMRMQEARAKVAYDDLQSDFDVYRMAENRRIETSDLYLNMKDHRDTLVTRVKALEYELRAERRAHLDALEDAKHELRVTKMQLRIEAEAVRIAENRITPRDAARAEPVSSDADPYAHGAASLSAVLDTTFRTHVLREGVRTVPPAIDLPPPAESRKPSVNDPLDAIYREINESSAYARLSADAYSADTIAQRRFRALHEEQISAARARGADEGKEEEKKERARVDPSAGNTAKQLRDIAARREAERIERSLKYTQKRTDRIIAVRIFMFLCHF